MKVCLIEDNRILAKSIRKGLQKNGILSHHFVRGDDGENFFFLHHTSIDVLVLDLMLPGKSGEEICKNIRRNNIDTPLLMLTAKDTSDDTVKGLMMGADDYLTKPFAFQEFLARLYALSRRKDIIEEDIIQITPHIIIDFQRKSIIKYGKEYALSPKEFAILEVLGRNIGRTLSRNQIFDKAFDFAADNWSNSIDVHIKNIRKKIFHDNNEDPLKTVRGIGYRLEKIR